MKEKRILFMGTPVFARIVLEKLIEQGYSIIGVVTQPDKPVGRKKILTMSSVKQAAMEHQIPVYQPRKIKTEVDDLLNLSFDCLITCAYGQILPKVLLDKPEFGCVNVHASLLPKYRGGAPIQRAIMDGETQSGVSIMKMIPKMDAGPVCAQSYVTITENDTYGTLHDKLAISGADLLIAELPKILAGRALFSEQDEERVTFARTISSDDEHISFNDDVCSVYNHMRGLIPVPASFAYAAGKKIKFYDVEYTTEQHGVPGEIVGLVEKRLAICAINGTILINKIQMEGKSVTDSKSFWAGYQHLLVHQICE